MVGYTTYERTMPERAKRSPHFAAVVQRLMRGKGQREAARETGVNATTLGEMLMGFVPGYRMVERFANAEVLALTPGERQELFEAAGYIEPVVLAKTRLFDALSEIGSIDPGWITSVEQDPASVDAIVDKIRRRQ